MSYGVKVSRDPGHQITGPVCGVELHVLALDLIIQKVPYFEEVSFKPYLLLSDYITILHPDYKNHQLKYYRPVK